MKSAGRSSSARALAAALLLAVCAGASGQLLSHGKLDNDIPDMPAFKALGIDPDNLLRPADPKSFALMLADQTSTLRLIPQSFAAEFAPARLFGARRLTMGEYIANPSLYDWRLSLGSKRGDDSTGGSTVAGGIRFTFGDSSDLHFIRRVVDLRDSLYSEQMAAYPIAHPQPEEGAPDSAQTRWDAAADKYADSVASELVDNRIGELRDEYPNEWNRRAFDVAYAITASSPDSFTRGLIPVGHMLWVSWASPVRSGLQYVVGGNGVYSKPDSVWALNYSAAGRLVYGIDGFKVDIKGQYQHDGAADKNTWLVGLGAEAMVFSGGWVEFTLNREQDIAGGGARLVPGLRCRLTMPESFTKF